jgi:hypothetical protein
MKLRFEIDQAECFRKGIDTPKSIITIEVDPAKIPINERNLIADRLDGIDVCELVFALGKKYKSHYQPPPHIGPCETGQPNRILAKTPDYAGLIEAIQENQKEIEQEEKRHAALKAFRGSGRKLLENELLSDTNS